MPTATTDHGPSLEAETKAQTANNCSAPTEPKSAAAAATATAKVIHYKDGVFSNLNAKPEVIRVDELSYEDKPPPYHECVMDMPPSYHEALDDVDVLSTIVIDDLEVGNGAVFVAHCLLGIIFHVIGVVAGLLLAHTHAGRYGSLSALGILMLIVSMSVEESPRISAQVRPVLSVSLFVGGYALFIASLFLFQRTQDRAKEIYRSSFSR